jgi:hypothetical protein
LIKSQLLYQLSYPRLHFPHGGAGRIEADRVAGKLIFGKILFLSISHSKVSVQDPSCGSLEIT